MSYTQNEQLVAQQLAARNLPGLFEVLLKLKGIKVGKKYTLKWLYAVGGQSILYLGQSSEGKNVIIKLAFLPYHRAAYIRHYWK